MKKTRHRAVVEQFNRTSDDYLSKHLRPETLRETRRLFDLAETTTPYDKALDLGCGPGVISEELARIADQVWGVDSSAGMIDIATARVNGTPLKHRVHFGVGSAEHLPFDNDQFDLVFCVGVLRYLDSWERGLQEIYRVLKPNGVLVLTFYYRFSIQWFVMCLLGRPLLPLVLLARGQSVKDCLLNYRAEPLPFSYRRFIKVFSETGFREMVCQHSGFEVYPIRRLLPGLSRRVYLWLESTCFNSRSFGWLGSICIVKGRKVPINELEP